MEFAKEKTESFNWVWITSLSCFIATVIISATLLLTIRFSNPIVGICFALLIPIIGTAGLGFGIGAAVLRKEVWTGFLIAANALAMIFGIIPGMIVAIATAKTWKTTDSKAADYDRFLNGLSVNASLTFKDKEGISPIDKRMEERDCYRDYNHDLYNVVKNMSPTIVSDYAYQDSDVSLVITTDGPLSVVFTNDAHLIITRLYATGHKTVTKTYLYSQEDGNAFRSTCVNIANAIIAIDKASYEEAVTHDIVARFIESQRGTAAEAILANPANEKGFSIVYDKEESVLNAIESASFKLLNQSEKDLNDFDYSLVYGIRSRLETKFVLSSSLDKAIIYSKYLGANSEYRTICSYYSLPASDGEKILSAAKTLIA